MRLLSPNVLSLASGRRKFEQARAGIVLLVAVVFVLGVAVGVFFASRTARDGSRDNAVGDTSPGTSSEPARSVQQQVVSPLITRPPVDASAIEEVRRVLSDVSAVSLDDGTRILREAALKEFTAAAKEAQSRMSEAQQRLAAAQSGGSEAEQRTAMQQVQQAQSEQTEKIKEIAARLQAQIAAFEQLKGGGRPGTLK